MRTPEQRAAWATYMREWSRRNREKVNARNLAAYYRDRDQRLAVARERYRTDPAYRESKLAPRRKYPDGRPHWSELFWAKVDKSGDCWLWTGARQRGTYGVSWNGERVEMAHRISYRLLVGPVPDGLQLDHLCFNPPCVNPAHLEPVTGHVNGQRANAAGVNGWALHWRKKTHCPQGHAYDEANTYITKDGWRSCRACSREKARARKAGLHQ